jgi:hypothetical protein
MERALFAIALGCVCATACVRVSTTRLATAQASVPTDSVRVFATQSPGDYTEMAVLRAPGTGVVVGGPRSGVRSPQRADRRRRIRRAVASHYRPR